MKVEYKTHPGKEVTIIMANDLDTSSKSELKKLTIVTKGSTVMEKVLKDGKLYSLIEFRDKIYEDLDLSKVT